MKEITTAFFAAVIITAAVGYFMIQMAEVHIPALAARVEVIHAR